MNLPETKTRSYRIKIVLLLAPILFATGNLSAQTSSRVSLPYRSITLGNAFKEIEKQTGSIVVANLDKLDISQKVELRKSEGTISEILEQLLAGTGLTYRTNGKYIMIVPPPAKKPAPRQAPPQPQPSYYTDLPPSNFETETKKPAVEILPEEIIRYDTIRTVKPHEGIFNYPNRAQTPERTDFGVNTPFAMETPPFVSIKTNLLYAATLTPNLGIEFGLGKKATLELSGGNNRWKRDGDEDDNKKLVHWTIKTEARYWLCERFNGHFFGAHLFYSKYNIGGYKIPMLFDKEYRYEGDAFGAGVSYGYHWMWSKRWGMEFNLGVGVASLDYKKKDCEKCGSTVGDYKKTYFGPTSAGIKLMFIIK